MKKFRVILPYYLTDCHLKATRELLNNLNGVKIIEDTTEYITIEVERQMVDVIKDLSYNDYITIMENF